MQNKLLKKFMEFGVGSLLTLLLGFISSPIITRLISPEQNGKFSMFLTVGNLVLMIVMLGLDQSYVRFFHDEEELSRGKLLKKCIIIPLITSCIVSFFMLIFYKDLSEYMVGKKSLLIVILLSIYLISNVILRFSLLQVRMKQKGKLYSVINVIQKISNLISVILLFYIFNNSYITLIIAAIISTIIPALMGIIYERESWLDNSGMRVLKTSRNDLIRYGIPLIFTMAITWVFQSTDRIVIKHFSGYLELGLYNGAMTIISLLNAVQNTFTTFWTPVAFERYSKNPNDKEFFKNINQIVTVSMIIIAIGLISAKDLIVLLLGAKYREAVFIFPFLVFMPIMFTISETTVLGINFRKNPKEHIKIAIISAIVNVVGNIILVPIYGAIGAAISTGISYVIFYLCRTYFASKYYKVDFQTKKFLVVTCLMYVLAIYSSFNTFNLVILILTLVILYVVYLLYKDVINKMIGYAINGIKNIKKQKNV